MDSIRRNMLSEDSARDFASHFLNQLKVTDRKDIRRGGLEFPWTQVAEDGTMELSAARSLVTGALCCRDSYWFPRFATDMNVTCDGLTIRWQEVDLIETSEDRTRFNGLWQMEVRRVSEEAYQVLAQLVDESERERILLERDRRKRAQEDKKNLMERRREKGLCALCGEKFSLADKILSPRYYFFATIHERCNGKFKW